MKRALLLAAATAVLILLAHPLSNAAQLGSDPFSDLTDGGGLISKYPLSAYSLDTHVDSSLVKPSTLGEEGEALITNILWTAVRLWNALIFWLVGTAFSLDLLSANGPLQPIAKAIRNINERVLGDPWMIAAIAAAGFWALKKGIVERKHSEAASSLAISVVLVICVMFVVFRPIQTVGQAATWSNDISQGVLVGVNTGGLETPDRSKRRIVDQMVRAMMVEPWAQLEFGGLSHCVDGSKRDKDGYPKPVSRNDPSRTTCRNHMKVVNGTGGYAPRFLKQPAGSDARDNEFEALEKGEIPNADSVGQMAGYHVDKSDSPAVDIQQSGGADQRLGMAALIFAVSGAWGLLFGGLAILIMLVQVGALLILAFSPVIMLAAVMPGPGHGLAVAWGKKLLLLVLVFKPAFAFVMAMLIVIHTSLAPGTSSMGWLPAYALIGSFYALVIWKHKWVGQKMQVASSRDSSKVERTVTEKTVQAGAFVAAPLAATWGAMRGKQEHAPQSTPREPQEPQEPQPEHTSSGAEHQQPAKPAPQPASASSTPSPVAPVSDAQRANTGVAVAVGAPHQEEADMNKKFPFDGQPMRVVPRADDIEGTARDLPPEHVAHERAMNNENVQRLRPEPPPAPPARPQAETHGRETELLERAIRKPDGHAPPPEYRGP